MHILSDSINTNTIRYKCATATTFTSVSTIHQICTVVLKKTKSMLSNDICSNNCDNDYHLMKIPNHSIVELSNFAIIISEDPYHTDCLIDVKNVPFTDNLKNGE